MDFTIHKLSYSEADMLVQLLKVFEDVFEMEPFAVPDTEYLVSLLKNPEILFMVALNQQQVIGGLSAYVVPQYYSKTKQLYIHDLAVSTKYHRMGVGTKLITSLADHCRMMGYEEMFVAAEKADTHALEFYRSTGATSLESVHFFYDLRSGEQ